MTTASKNVLITGVSGGLGGKIAESLLRDGWAVWGVSRTKPEISHQQFSWIQSDLTKPGAVAALIKKIPSDFDAFILAAGMSGPVGPGLTLSLNGWRETFEVNFFSPLAIAQTLLVKANPGACAVFFSGGGAANPRPLVGPYAASKLAVAKLAEQLALEHPEFRFYAIAPGAHNTAIYREQRAGTGEPEAKFAEFSQVEKLIRIFLDDTGGRLNGKWVHVRDDVGKLLSVSEGGTIRRVEAR